MVKTDLQKIFILAAGILIDSKGRLLIVRKRNTTKFMLPGGKIDIGETPVNALMRELKEEVDIDISPEQALFIQEYEAPAANEPDYFIRSNLFLIQFDQEVEATPTMEIEEALWVEAKNIEDYDLAPLMKSFVFPLWLAKMGKDEELFVR